MRRKRSLVVAAAALACIPVRAFGCECVQSYDPKAVFASAPIVFVGKVVKVEAGVATVKVKRLLKGSAHGTVLVHDAEPGMCVWRVFEKGLGDYLITAFDNFYEDELAVMDFCPKTRPLKDLPGVLDKLKQYAKEHKAELAQQEDGE